MRSTMKIVTTTFCMAFVFCPIPARPQTTHSDAFAKACQDRLPKVQEDRRVCVVGTVMQDRKIEVLYGTRNDLIGKTMAVYGSRVVQQQRVPLGGMTNLIGRIVVVGGFIDSNSIYSATVLSGVPSRSAQ